MAHSLIPGHGFVEETGAGQQLIPRLGFIDDAASGSAAALAGNAADVASATGDLSTPGGAAALGGAATDTVTATAALSTGIALAGNAADVASGSGTMASTPTFVSDPLARNNTDIVANVTLTYVRLYNPVTGDLVVSKTGIVTDAAGVFRITDPSVVSGTQYAVDWLEPTGIRCMPVKAAV